MIRKSAGIAALLVILAAPVFAQDSQSQSAQAPSSSQASTTTPKRKIVAYLPKYEISGGPTYYSFYAPTGQTLGMLGWNAAFQYNWKRWIGAEAEGFGAYYNQGSLGKTSIYGLMIGPQVYPFGHRKVTVFVHALAGGGHYRIAFPAFGGFGGSAIAHTTSVYEVGGGLDYNWRQHLGFRLVQFDYDKADFFTGNLNRAGYRVSIGVVYRFGQR